MNKRIRNRLLLALLFFAVLFTIVAGLQYWFMKDQLTRATMAEMNDWADEVIEEINYRNKWDLAGYRRSNPEAPNYFVITINGLLVDTAGYVKGMLLPVSLPDGLVYDRPFSIVSKVGEPWRLIARRVRGGSVILGVSLYDIHSDVDDRLSSNFRPFGATIDSAAQVTDRQVDLIIAYAVVDNSGTLRSAAGGIPLSTNPKAVDPYRCNSNLVTFDGDPYLTIFRQITDNAKRDVANVVLFRDIGLEQQVLHNSLRFNMAVGAVCWFCSALLVAFYLYGRRSPRMTCEQAISQDESQVVEFKSSLRWDLKLGRASKDIEWAVVKTIAAFLNTDGGILMIGVSDEKLALGLDADYSTITGKPNKDGFLLTLQQVLSNAFGLDNFTRYLHLEFCTVSGKEICVVYVTPARGPIFVDEKTLLGTNKSFYIRVSNATKSLSPPEMLSYVRVHWGV